ncbi:hypothetical protein FGKAn22_06030 [Ferrigenium kumadai]|uniref:Uncharacterized protein n=1 Tax=Ferrigenium kumadai TaxID=1682490 RepID=A0AAN1SZD5_9PROT|nr:hypothetical protein [Ferrigenium kumadai]BBI98910.1 hypothetical protein FGKAn22_06030 [Ferrigenium kumadai]
MSTLYSQRGYILPFVLVMLVMLMVGSAGFFYRSAQGTQLSGATRDYDQARLLAESGMNLVLGRITNFSATSAVVSTSAAVIPCIAAASAPAVNDLNCNDVPDANEAKPASFTPPLPLPVGYEYFLTNAAGAGITETAPGILQRVANGEARNSSNALTDQSVLTGTTNLRVNDLFISSTLRPLLLTQNKDGLTFSSKTWDKEPSAEKTAVWLEVSRDPDPAHASWFSLYLCSAAQVSNAKAYVQRFIGAYTDQLGAQVIAPLSEASNHP